jgi:hypothetical protein
MTYQQPRGNEPRCIVEHRSIGVPSGRPGGGGGGGGGDGTRVRQEQRQQKLIHRLKLLQARYEGNRLLY